MAPAYVRAAAELEPGYRLLKLATEAVPAIAGRYQIRSLPPLRLFSGGQPVAQTAGAMSAAGIVAWAQAHAGPPQDRSTQPEQRP
jgi:thioredoxin 2